MNFLRSFLAIFITSLAASVSADLIQRDVFVPMITEPTNETVWSIGENYTVTWDTTDAPVNITNSNGLIMLRKGGLTTPVVLAYNFSILAGQTNVSVPLLLNGSDYQIVLFGDSGNFSPNFTISSNVTY